MNVKKMVVTSALAIATGASAASMANGYPAQQLPLFFLQFPTMDPITDSCEGVCKAPNEDPGGPTSVNVDAVAIGPAP